MGAVRGRQFGPWARSAVVDTGQKRGLAVARSSITRAAPRHVLWADVGAAHAARLEQISREQSLLLKPLTFDATFPQRADKYISRICKSISRVCVLGTTGGASSHCCCHLTIDGHTHIATMATQSMAPAKTIRTFL